MSHSTAAQQNHVQHHFVDSEQQFDSAKFGMWIFLVTEILFFGGLFVAYIVYRTWNPELFIKASVQLDTIMGAANTAVLIFSSLTMALSIREIQLNRVNRSIMYMAITIVCALFFMVVKYFEYTHKFEMGIYPGAGYTYTGIDDPQANIFFSIYYMMTGLHGIHVIIGIGLISWLILKARAGAFNSAYYTPIEITGLYWHLVDIIWIFLFPLFYLID